MDRSEYRLYAAQSRKKSNFVDSHWTGLSTAATLLNCRIPRIDPLIYSYLSTIFPAPIGVVPASRDPGAYDLAVSYTEPWSILGLM